MEIREARPSELEEVVALQCLVYLPEGHERFWAYIRQDPSYRNWQTRVVVVGGRVVATLRVWDRWMRIGSRAVHVAGIGGVCTHPDYRGAGYATALMQDTVHRLRERGYHLGLLFTIIPAAFYRRLGWGEVPLAGFRVVPHRYRDHVEPKAGWSVSPFAESRDLEQVMACYDRYNAAQSGTVVRSPAYWHAGPCRIRGVLPTIVARRGSQLGGYLNYEVDGPQAWVNEVAYDRVEPTALAALIHQFLRECAARQVTEIQAEIPHRHPLVSLVVEQCAGDLHLTGNAEMMCYPLNLPALLERLLPEWQSRLAQSGRRLDPCTTTIQVEDQQVTICLEATGTLRVQGRVAAGDQGERWPADVFWRALLGESSWQQLQPTLEVRGVSVPAPVAALLSVLLPQQEVIFWEPDHF